MSLGFITDDLTEDYSCTPEWTPSLPSLIRKYKVNGILFTIL